MTPDRMSFANPAKPTPIPGKYKDKCFTEEELKPNVKFFMSSLRYGGPIYSPKENKVDDDKGRLDETRKFPSDDDYVFAFINDIIDHIDKTYKSSTDQSIKVRIDASSMMMDNI